MSKKPSRLVGQSLLDGLLKQNIVLMGALVTAPVIAAATTLQKSMVLACGFSLISFFTILLCRLIPHKIVYTLRITLYAIAAAVLYIPCILLMDALFGVPVVNSVGVYLPVMVTNALIMAKTESRFYLQSMRSMIPDSLMFVLGFDAVCLLMGGIREVLALGTLGGRIFALPFQLPAASTTFGGFILLGVLSAALRAIYNRTKSRQSKKTMTELIKER